MKRPDTALWHAQNEVAGRRSPMRPHALRLTCDRQTGDR
ncbi:MAG: hypothetical protein AVDCRST_MAG88-1149, partial [uncultured Thermomicrobiales bacterium]